MSGVNLGKISDHELEDADWVQAGNAFQELSALPILICDDPNMTVDKIRSQLRTTPDVDFVIIDFMTLLRSSRQYDSRNLEVGAISRELKLLAKELKIPIMALSQLNRNVTDEQEPSLADIRDSGELEQNADICIFLWNVNSNLGYKGVKVAKNRMGMTGTVQMRFTGENMKFEELSEIDELVTNGEEETASKKTSRRKRWSYEGD